jgi:ubiquitin C-terminal hydrolase
MALKNIICQLSEHVLCFGVYFSNSIFISVGCNACKKISTTDHPLKELSVDIPSDTTPVDLDTLVATFFRESEIDYRCENQLCHRYSTKEAPVYYKTMKSCRVQETPEVLVIHIRR